MIKIIKLPFQIIKFIWNIDDVFWPWFNGKTNR